MRTKNNIKLDYTHIKTRAPEVIKIISDYFEDNFKLNEIFEVLPERPKRYNDVGLVFEITLYDKFDIRFVTGESWFTYVFLFNEDPVGYKLRDKVVRPTIYDSLITDNYEEYLHRSFHPTDENIKYMLNELNDFLQFVIEEKEKSPNKNYFEIAFKKTNEIKGFDYERKFNLLFEKI